LKKQKDANSLRLEIYDFKNLKKVDTILIWAE
jgi:hypothetical protein